MDDSAHADQAGQPPASPAGRPIELAAGLGDPERERLLLPALQEAGDIVVVQRCLAADQVLQAVQSGRVDAVLLAADLHRLSRGVLADLRASSVPLVLLAPRPAMADGQDGGVAVLPLDADAGTVRQAVRAAARRERFAPRGPGPDHRPAAISAAGAPPAPAEPASSAVSLSPLVVTSGPGSPGRTTVALNLAAALGAVAPTVLVEADLDGPSLAVLLDADPTRNLALLAHAAPQTEREWEHAVAQELQPLAARSPHGVLLCGIPKPQLRASISSGFLTALLEHLQRSYRYVVVDTGATLLGPDAGVHRAALRSAGQVLLVASADLVGLWRARTTLGLLKDHAGLDPERVALVVNAHQPRHHHQRGEIEWALGMATAAVIPFDPSGMQQAAAAQQPVVLAGRSRAGKALLDLAERVHEGTITLPVEAAGPQGGWRRWLLPLRQAVLRQGGAASPASSTRKGAHDGSTTASLT